MSLNIRKAALEDAKLLSLEKEKVINSHYLFLREEEKKAWIDNSANEAYFTHLIERSDTFIIIIEDDGNFAGACSLTKIVDGAEQWADVQNIFSVGTPGVGKTLLGSAIGITERWQMPELRVPVLVEDGKSLAFFQRWDFFPALNLNHSYMPERRLLYLKRPVRQQPRTKDDGSIYQD